MNSFLKSQHNFLLSAQKLRTVLTHLFQPKGIHLWGGIHTIAWKEGREDPGEKPSSGSMAGTPGRKWHEGPGRRTS